MTAGEEARAVPKEGVNMPRVGLEELSISGVWLHKRGNDVVVEVERKMADGTFQWFEIIVESGDGEYSHIAEPSKIQSLFWERKP